MRGLVEAVELLRELKTQRAERHFRSLKVGGRPSVNLLHKAQNLNKRIDKFLDEYDEFKRINEEARTAGDVDKSNDPEEEFE